LQLLSQHFSRPGISRCMRGKHIGRVAQVRQQLRVGLLLGCCL
jgi:hypothetical protein